LRRDTSSKRGFSASRVFAYAFRPKTTLFLASLATPPLKTVKPVRDNPLQSDWALKSGFANSTATRVSFKHFHRAEFDAITASRLTGKLCGVDIHEFFTIFLRVLVWFLTKAKLQYFL
jgi:hypothetical protein